MAQSRRTFGCIKKKKKKTTDVETYSTRPALRMSQPQTSYYLSLSYEMTPTNERGRSEANRTLIASIFVGTTRDASEANLVSASRAQDLLG